MNEKCYISGTRIYLREVRLSDVSDQYVAWMNDPDVNEFLETRFKPQTVASITAYVRQMNTDPNNIFLAMMTVESDAHIGNIKIGPVNWFHRSADLSLFLGAKKYWGKGFGTEAIRLAADFAFNSLNLHKLNAGIYEGNQGSIRAFEKAGFVKEGCRFGQRFFKGRYVDEVVMGLLNPKDLGNESERSMKRNQCNEKT